MKAIVRLLSVLFLVFSIALNISAHEGHHDEKNDTVQKAVVVGDTSKVIISTTVAPKPTGFSTLHPLVVHFPIVLLIVAALLQLIGIFYRKNNWDLVVLFLLIGGVLGAYLASNNFHAHTEGLPTEAARILELHEFYASLTLFSSIGAILLKIAGMFIFKSKKRVFEIVTALVLLFSATSVSIAGHWGAYLTHVEGVGSQGKYIEKE